LESDAKLEFRLQLCKDRKLAGYHETPLSNIQ